ncbi:uracil-DNA glycosylase isoform 3-T3 [Chlamydotis macqueenii]
MAAARLPLLGLRLGRRAPRPLCSPLFARPFQLSAAKKAKAESGASPLSPEQLERIRRNKEAARQRLAERNVPPGFGESWRRQLEGEFSKPYFVELMAFVAEERKRHTVYPPPEQVFTWTRMCDIRDVKVVILGQDPYHGPNQAHGLCFSVQKPVPPPPSLENIYKELSTDIEDFTHPGHGDLTGWAKQGVLLLNAVLTVRAHQATSPSTGGFLAVGTSRRQTNCSKNPARRPLTGERSELPGSCWGLTVGNGPSSRGCLVSEKLLLT